MSAGPIKAWRESHLPERVSEVKASERVCARRPGTWRAECGRKKAVFAEQGMEVTCPECKAAVRADVEVAS